MNRTVLAHSPCDADWFITTDPTCYPTLGLVQEPNGAVEVTGCIQFRWSAAGTARAKNQTTHGYHGCTWIMVSFWWGHGTNQNCPTLTADFTQILGIRASLLCICSNIILLKKYPMNISKLDLFSIQVTFYHFRSFSIRVLHGTSPIFTF